MKPWFEVIAAGAGSSPHGQLVLPGTPAWAGLPALLRELLVASPTDGLAPTNESKTVDWDDVRATLAGDGPAYERLVRRYQDPIAAYMWRFTRDRREWEELVQDVFVEAYFSLKTYAGRAPLLHWLKRVATRIGYRFWKNRRQRREVPLPAEADSTLVMADNAEAAYHAAELVHYLLSQLGPRDRLVMTLSYLEECSVKQTAELTGWSQSMVRVQSHRARRRLAKICREMGVEL